MKNMGLYIHIPFCSSKCPYCDFFSVKAKESVIYDYIEALKNYIKHYSDKKINILTIFFGGGTPTILKAEDLCEILNYIKSTYNVAENAEISLECNPNTVNYEYLHKLVLGGFNRISFGVQSLNDEELKVLNRQHTAQQAYDIICDAKKAGFNNISVDLMLGIPKQNIITLKETLQILCSLPINHISAYILKIEKGTLFYKNKEKYTFADDDLCSELYIQTVKILKENSFNQYEISNFAKDGFKCKHNLIYWHCEEYMAFGPTAYFYFNGKRGHFEKGISKFIENSKTNNFLPIIDEDGGDLLEYFMLNLRLVEGVNLNSLEEKYQVSTLKLKEKAKIYQAAGFLILNNNNIYLTPKGFLVSNEIITCLFESLEKIS